MKRLSLLLIGILLFGFASLHSQIPDYVPKTGLIGWWPFNGNAQDESGNGNHGVLMNNVKFIKDRFDDSSKAITLKGDSSYVVTSLKTIQSNSYTISCWFKTSEIMSNEIGLVVSRRAPFQSDGLYLSDTNGYIQCVTECDQRFHYNGKTEKYNDDKWHHFVSVFDGKKMFGYVDGKLFSIQNLEVITCIVSPFEFGRDNPYGRYFKGDIDDIGIWNRALSEQEVKDLYDSKQVSSLIPDNVPKTGLIGWWPFNGNAQDESGNGNHGTVNGAVLTTNRYNQNNTAYFFDGKNDFISTIYSGVLENQSRTFSFWINTNSSEGQQVIGYGNQPPSGGEFNVLLNQVCQGISVDIHDNYITYNHPSQFGINTWNHVVVTYNNTISDNIEGVRFYINGDLVSTSIACSNPVNKIINTLNSPIFFGKYQSGDFAYVSGKLDDIGIWDRVLDSIEIKRLFNNESSQCSYAIQESDTTICPGTSLKLNAIQTSATKSVIPQDGLIGYWPFNGNANDESGNGNHGRVDGAILTTNRCGKKDKAYYFNGIDDKITIRDSSNLRPKSITCAAWVYCEDPNPMSQILSKNAGNNITESINMVISNNLGLNFTANIGGPDYYGNWLTSSSKVKDSSWQYMTFVFDSENNKITTYINDKVVRDAIELLEITYDSLPWSIGSHRENGQWSWHFKGKIDDISIWNRPLKIDEVVQAFSYSDCGCEDSLSDSLFTWSDGQKGRTITVTPDTSTTYVLTVTDGTTIHKDSIKVTIGGDSCYSCTYAILEQDTVICEGTMLQLHAELSDTTKAYIPKDGLIGYWPFNGNANDESGNGNHGVVDKANLTTDKNNISNSAYQFFKSGSKISVPDSKDLNNPFVSISFWLKTKDTSLQSYIYKAQEGTAQHEEYSINSNFSNSSSLEFSVKNGSNCIAANGWERNIKDIVVFDNSWHHIVATFDGIFSRIYVDTIMISEIQKPLNPIDSCPGGEILFGKGWDNRANLEGVLDDIAIWNRAISPEEVKTMYKLNRPKKSLGLPIDGLIGYWPFNGNAQDQSSFANHGEVNGATLTTDRCEKRNSAYEFNGIDNFIEVNDSESLSIVESVTMSSWIYLDSMRNLEQGIATKWWQGINCTQNTDAYNFLLSKLVSQSEDPRVIAATNIYSGREFFSNETISRNSWAHILFVHSKSKGGKIYINGKLSNTYDQAGDICQSTNPLLIGADNNQGSYWRFFDGKIDDVAIWNRALSDSEIVEVYNAGSCNCLDTLSEDKFKWSTGEKGRKITVSPNTSTMYTLEVERDNQIDRDTIHVKVLESPTPDIFGHVKVYERQVNYSYYSQLNDSSTYEWTITGNGKLSSTNGGSSILVDFKEPGYAYLTVTETNKYGCKKDTTITIRIYGITDINESEKNSQMLTIYPNPINEYNSLTIQAYLPPSSRSFLTISDMLGKTLQTIELGSQDSYSEVKAPVSTEGLSNGVYMIQLHINGNVISDKVIINR